MYVISSLMISGYPIWLIAKFFAELLGILPDVPVKEQDNGIFWLILFLLEAIVLFLGAYAVVSVLLRKINGWSNKEWKDIFWKLPPRYPEHWYKNGGS